MSAYVYETIETEHVIAEMIHDQDAENPRTAYDNVGTIIGWSRDTKLGEDDTNREYIEDVRLTILNHADLPVVCRYCGEPITGEHMDVGNFAHEEDWDAVEDLSDLTADQLLCNRNPIEPDMSKVVWFGLDFHSYDGSLTIRDVDDFTDTYAIDAVIYVTQEKVMDEWGSSDDPVEMAENYLRGEVREYSEYLQGNVWGVVVTDKRTGKELEACWGYVGTEYAEGILKEEAEAYTKVIAEEIASEEAAAQAPVLLNV